MLPNRLPLRQRTVSCRGTILNASAAFADSAATEEKRIFAWMDRTHNLSDTVKICEPAEVWHGYQSLILIIGLSAITIKNLTDAA